MQEDFHYYATYCAAFLCGYNHKDSLDIAYSSQYVDCCSAGYIAKIKGPHLAATTQYQPEIMDTTMSLMGVQNTTRIWTSFHFLPGDLYAKPANGKYHPKMYLDKYRLICGPNGDLLVDTVNLAKDASLQAIGLAMHVLTDTWAHRYFAGTPSLVINNITNHFYEIVEEDGVEVRKKVRFNHNPASADIPSQNYYTNAIYQPRENVAMNLGHARAGHLPDYSYVKYAYLPAWDDYNEIIKDNPKEYYSAFCQMIYALKYLKGEIETFEKDTYSTDVAAPYKDEIMAILKKPQLSAEEDWKAFAEKLSGESIEAFNHEKYNQEYLDSDKKDDTFLGKFFIASMLQKSMVTNRIFKSKNMLLGISLDFTKYGFKGIKDFKLIIEKYFNND